MCAEGRKAALVVLRRHWQVSLEPVVREPGHCLQRTGLLEEMRCARHNLQSVPCLHVARSR
jgi:hypothetical protein